MKTIEVRCNVVCEFERHGIAYRLDFNPNVIEALFSKEDIVELFKSYENCKEPRVDYTAFEDVLDVVENNLFRIKAHRVDFELFYVNGLELLWHCEYYEDESSVFGTIEYSARNRVKEKSIMN